MPAVVLQHEPMEGPGVWTETLLEHGASVECVLVPVRGQRLNSPPAPVVGSEPALRTTPTPPIVMPAEMRSAIFGGTPRWNTAIDSPRRWRF